MSDVAGRLRTLLGRHGLWLTAVLTVVAFLGLFLAGEAGAVVDAVSGVDPWRFAAVLALATTGYLVRFLKWEYYLRTLRIDVSVRTSLVVFFSGLMMTVTPGKLGELWKAWFLRDLEDVPVARTATVVVAERVTDLLALCTFAGLGAVAYGESSAVLAAVAVVLLAGVAVLQWRSGVHWLLERLRAVPLLRSRVDDVASAYEGASDLFQPVPLAVALVPSLVGWGLEGVALWLVLEGIAPPASLLPALFVFGLGSVVGAVSMLPGGLGAAEASLVGGLLLFGYSQTAAVSATLVLRVGTLWYGVALGLLVFGCYRLSVRTDRGDRSGA